VRTFRHLAVITLRSVHNSISKVRLVLDGMEGKAHEVDTGIPQGSPVAPILFTTYLSGIFEEAEKRVVGVKALSFADDISL